MFCCFMQQKITRLDKRGKVAYFIYTRATTHNSGVQIAPDFAVLPKEGPI